MNSPYLLFLSRRDPIVGLAAHLAAGILALVLLTGAARAGSHSASPVTAAPSAIVQR